MNENEIYTVDDEIFKPLGDREKWFTNIFNTLNVENIYLINMIVRRTISGKSTYDDIIGYNNNLSSRLSLVNNNLNYIKKNGSAINTHIAKGREVQTIELSLNKDDNIEHINTSLNFKDLFIVEHTKFNYDIIIQQNFKSKTQKPYVNECIYPIYEKYDRNFKKYYIHFISLAKGRETSKGEIKEDNQEIISSPNYYGYGAFLLFVSDKKRIPDNLSYSISDKLNDHLLESLVEVYKEIEKQKKEAIEANRKIIKEMKDIAEHVNNARKVSDKIQARLESFGDIFTEWFTQGLKNVFTSGEKIGNYEKKPIWGEHTPENSTYEEYIKRLIVSLEDYFNSDDHKFIEYLYNELEHSKSKGNLETIDNIKIYYKSMDEYFPIGLVLFFFLDQEKYSKNYEECLIKIKGTNLSYKAIINGLNKMFFNSEIDNEKINIELEKNKYLVIRLTLDKEYNQNSNNLLSTLIHQHNREPEPYHKATTYIIRNLMGIDSENYQDEKLAEIKLELNERSYRTGLISHNKYIVEAKIEKNSFILRYLLYDESDEGI